MFTVTRMLDCPGPTLGDSVPLGTAETIDELHELLRELRQGAYKITSSEGRYIVRLDADVGAGDDRAFVELIVLATEGHGPGELVSQ